MALIRNVGANNYVETSCYEVLMVMATEEAITLLSLIWLLKLNNSSSNFIFVASYD